MTKLLFDLQSKTNGDFLDLAAGIFITEENSLVIGPYDSLRTYATSLWINKAAQEALMDRDARFGRRETDVIPTEKIRSGGFREAIKGKEVTTDQLKKLERKFARQRAKSRIPIEFNPRITDVHKEASEYFSSITLESHHIVEKSMLGDLKKNKGDLQNYTAPCVLIRGELHRRLYTTEGAKFRNNQNLNKKEMKEFYKELYAHPDFADLKAAAEFILDRVFS